MHELATVGKERKQKKSDSFWNEWEVNGNPPAAECVRWALGHVSVPIYTNNIHSNFFVFPGKVQFISWSWFYKPLKHSGIRSSSV